jgi:hypothetical protein
MREILSILQIITIFGLIFSPSLSYAFEIDPDIAKAYSASDYVMVAKILDQQIKSLKEKASKGENINYSDLHRKYLFLAHIQAWRLNNLEKGQFIYQEALNLKPSLKEFNKNRESPSTEFLYMGEIYEVKKDYPKARECYQKHLDELAAFLDEESKDLSILLTEDLIKLTKYQIDGINLKVPPSKKQTPLLPNLKLTSQVTHPMATLSILFLSPGAEYAFSIIQEGDLAKHIRQSPPDIGSMAMNYALVLNSSAASVTDESERAMAAYLSRYPDGYYSLSLRYLFYKFYKESAQTKKGEALLRELEKVGKKRGIELIVRADRRFSSPEKTWDTYRNALIEGNIDLAMECYTPGERRHKKIFMALGKEKMEEIGRNMGEIGRITGNEREAKYRIRRMEEGKEITYYIHFYNVDGEWKMEEF